MLPPPAPRPAAGKAAARLRMALRQLGFDEAGCVQRLGLKSMRETARRAFVASLRADPAPVKAVDPLDALVSLFLLHRRLEADALGRQLRADLEELELVRGQGPIVQARALLFPCQDLYIATDLVAGHGADNPVMPLFPESYDLAAFTLRRPAERGLDLCTGSGVHALLASRHCREVEGVDINPRAVALSRFNAWLNGIANAVFLAGDLYTPLARDRPYDLVTANPPYNPELKAAGEDYRSGGESGEDVLARVLGGLPEFLGPGGHAQVITLLIDREGETLEQRIRDWMGPPGAFDVLVLSREVSYRPHVLKGGKGLSTEEEALHRSWERQRIRGFSFGLLSLRPTPCGRRPVFARGPFGTAESGPEPVAVDEVLESLSRTSAAEGSALA